MPDCPIAIDNITPLTDSRSEMQDEVYREIERSLTDGTPLVVATVAATRGSTPRKAGAKMAVRPDGSFCGTIGGGCGEAEVWQEAMNVLDGGKPRLVVVDLTESPEGEDKICGGIMEVFVERVV
jgi:xanthine dehydrogenase accessory factor